MDEINANATAYMWETEDQRTFSVVCANYKVIYFLLTVNSNLQTPVWKESHLGKKKLGYDISKKHTSLNCSNRTGGKKSWVCKSTRGPVQLLWTKSCRLLTPSRNTSCCLKTRMVNVLVRDSMLWLKKNKVPQPKASWGGKSWFQLTILRSHAISEINQEELKSGTWR